MDRRTFFKILAGALGASQIVPAAKVAQIAGIETTSKALPLGELLTLTVEVQETIDVTTLGSRFRQYISAGPAYSDNGVSWCATPAAIA